MEVKTKIADVLSNHNLMHLATIDENGYPKVRGVDFAAGDQENVLYFFTRKDSNKIRHITNKKQISIAVDHDCPTMEDLNKLMYIKAQGSAEMIETEAESQKAMNLLINKFPFLADIPGDPRDMVCVRVTMDKIILVDNTVHFGHEEVCQFN